MQLAQTTKPVGRATRVARYAYLGLTWLFLAWVVTQVFLIGLSFFTAAGYEPHIEFGHTFGIIILALFIAALLARLPLRLILLTVLLFILYGLQYVFVNIATGTGAGWVFAFHPVNALVIFGLGLFLARRARAFVPAPLGTQQRASGPPHAA